MEHCARIESSIEIIVHRSDTPQVLIKILRLSWRESGFLNGSALTRESRSVSYQCSGVSDNDDDGGGPLENAQETIAPETLVS